MYSKNRDVKLMKAGARGFGGMLMLWGCWLMWGSVVNPPLAFHDIARAGFMTGLCCLLGGTWLCLAHDHGQTLRRVRQGVALALGGLAALEIIRNGLATVLPDGGAAVPGQWAFGRSSGECPVAATIFLLGASVMLLVTRPLSNLSRLLQQGVLYGALAMTFVFGVAHVFNRLIGINLFDFGLPRFAEGWPRVVGAFLFLSGLVLTSWRFGWFATMYRRRPDRQVFAIGTVLLLAVGVTSGFLGASVLAQHTTAFFKQTLGESLRVNGQTLSSSVLQANVMTVQAALSLDKPVAGVSGISPAALQTRLAQHFALYQASGVEAMSLADGTGKILAQVGEGISADSPRLRLNAALQAWLVRDRGNYYLEIQQPVALGKGVALQLTVVHLLNEVSIYLEHARGLGGYGQVLICVPAIDGIDCLPRPEERYFLPDGVVSQSVTSPSILAVSGQEGVSLFSREDGGQTVVAYTHLPQLGVTMIQEVDTRDIFAPLRKKVRAILLAVTLIVFVGAAVLYRRVRPMVNILTETTRHLRDIQSYAGIGSWEWQRASGLVHFSEELCRLFDLPETPCDYPVEMGLAVVHPEDRAKFKAAFQATSRSGASFDLDFRVIDRDGRERVFNGQGHPVRQGSGQVSRIIGFVQDISDRKQGERILRDSFLEIEDLYNNAPCGYYSLDQRGVVVAINDTALANFGYRREEVVGKLRMVDLVVPEMQEAYARGFAQVVRQGHLKGALLEFRRRDGRRFHGVANATAIRDGNGRFLRSRTSFFDITDRVVAERQLFSMTRLYALLSKANQAIIRSESNHQLYESICRIAVDDGGFVMAWIGEVIEDRVLPRCHAGHEAGYLALITRHLERISESAGPRGQVIRQGAHMVCQDIVEDPITAPMRDEATARGYRSSAVFPLMVEDNIVGLLSLYADQPGAFSGEVVALLDDLAQDISLALTARRERERRTLAEEELRQLNQELEWRVEARTRQYEMANRELEAFSYSVSHDLRAPLRSIDGFSQIVLQHYGESLGETGKGYLERVCRATRRMGELIDDLLKLARVNQVEENRSEVDLSAMAEGILAELARTDEAREVTIRIAPGLSIFGDRGLLRIALENLLRNAWKFTGNRPDGEIEFGRYADATQGQVFYVKDNGAGFDSAHAGRLFKPFQRLHTQREFDGSGIGLATVHKVINRHAGQIWAEGQVGKGACFYFTLPQRRRWREVGSRDGSKENLATRAKNQPAPHNVAA